MNFSRLVYRCKMEKSEHVNEQLYDKLRYRCLDISLGGEKNCFSSLGIDRGIFFSLFFDGPDILGDSHHRVQDIRHSTNQRARGATAGLEIRERM